MRRIIFLFLILLFSTQVTAQDDDAAGYALRLPRPDEYLEAIPLALHDWESTFPASKTPHHVMVDAMRTELYGRYPLTYGSEGIRILFDQSFERLNAAFHAFQQVRSPYGNVLDNSTWASILLNAWLREHPGSLEVVEGVHVGGLDVSVQQWIDFDGDGIDELIIGLHLLSISENLILQRDASRPEGYRIVGSFLQDDYSMPSAMRANESLEGIRDVTGDGLPEIIIRSERGYSHYSHTDYDISILSWHEGYVQNVVIDPSYGWQSNGNLDSGFTLEFVNLDADPALEIELLETIVDHWECHSTRRRLYNWVGGRYKAWQYPEQMIDSLGCAMRQAEPLMWDYQFEAAIPIYEHGLYVGRKASSNFPIYLGISTWELYARTRLALAYDLVGRHSDAQRVIDQLPSIKPSTPIQRMILSLKSNSSPGSRCAAAYNVFMYIHEYAEMEIPTGFEYYDRLDLFSLPSPERAGCDAPWLITNLLTDQTFTTAISPIEQLEAIDIHAKHFITMDLDNNGELEWLVWPEALVPPVFFFPNGGNYQISRPELSYPSEFTEIGIRSIPDYPADLLFDWTYFGRNVDHPITPYFMRESERCFYDGASHLGNTALWSLQAGQLAILLKTPLCEPRTLEKIFQSDGVHLWIDAIDGYQEAVYRWDMSQQTFVVDGAAIVSAPTPRAPYEPAVQLEILTDGPAYDQLVQVVEVYGQREYEQALALLDDFLAHDDDSFSPLFVNAAHYWRALTLEKMGRIDEALAEYVYLVENSPDFAWGRLAALHVIRR
jgi:hypothetical protein